MTTPLDAANAQPSRDPDPNRATACLDTILAAHGGRHHWNSMSAIEGRLSCGGLALASRFQGRALRGLRFRVEPHERRVALQDFKHPGWIGRWSPTQVSLHDGNRLIEARPEPRRHFRRPANALAWDRLDVLYFAGYALWNYLSFPFLLAEPGVAVSVPDDDAARDGRRLVADFAPHVPTHSPRQVFHFDRAGLLVRHDYTAEVYGRWAHVANIIEASEPVGAGRIYTRRRVCPRMGPWQTLLPFPVMIWIHLDDLVVEPARNWP